MPWSLDSYEKRYKIDEYLEVWFLAMKEIGLEIVFGTAMVQTEKLNCFKGFMKSQQNFEWIQFLHKEQLWCGLEMKREGFAIKTYFQG